MPDIYIPDIYIPDILWIWILASFAYLGNP